MTREGKRLTVTVNMADALPHEKGSSVEAAVEVAVVFVKIGDDLVARLAVDSKLRLQG